MMLACTWLVSLRQGRVARATQFGDSGRRALRRRASSLAFTLGGQPDHRALHDRSLPSDPLSVYNGARGAQMDITFNELLFEHPLGAGLGRWGMAAAYFGTYSGVETSIWAEIQFTGWMIDGGVLMVFLYCRRLDRHGDGAWRRIADGTQLAAGAVRRRGAQRRISAPRC